MAIPGVSVDLVSNSQISQTTVVYNKQEQEALVVLWNAIVPTLKDLGVPAATLNTIKNSNHVSQLFHSGIIDKALENITELFFRDKKNLKVLPSVLQKFTNLKRLDLGNTGISELPEWVGNFQQLEYLEISNSVNEDLATSIRLPQSLGNLQNLKKLYLANTNFSDIPDSLGNLANLEVLTLHHCNAYSQPLPNSINKLVNLKEILVQHCHLNSIPTWIGNLKELTRLNVCGNDIESIPVQVLQLSQLEKFYFIGCKVREIPEFIVGLPKLRQFYIEGNPVKPEQLSESIKMFFADGSGRYCDF